MKTLARERDKAEILRRLKQLQPESHRRWGRMSAHQMICHLNDSCRIMTGERSASPISRLVPRTIVKWIALYVPAPWPPGIPTRPEVDPYRGGTKPTDFAADRAQLEVLVNLIGSGDTKNCEGRTHPIFGPMSEGAWMRWAYLHMDHHLRQFGL